MSTVKVLVATSHLCINENLISGMKDFSFISYGGLILMAQLCLLNLLFIVISLAKAICDMLGVCHHKDTPLDHRDIG